MSNKTYTEAEVERLISAAVLIGISWHKAELGKKYQAYADNIYPDTTSGMASKVKESVNL